ncbi:transmembrane protein [Xanthomonas arboricola pv. pruni str. MAFF 311562]|uniref:Transmembrane protein n=1 Tax=Xanthomonas arboricola pv. pruni str. MAFF 311562 TaxID=1414836 RepID=W4S5M4_9XANT|nr:transmembrane protein [Xanthomonas arboricola pv. pruni str. MAFF 311562]
MSNTPYSPDPRAHPGLHVIALLEAVKGTLALLAATGLEILGPLPLQDAVSTLIRRFNLDPDHGALPSLLKTISPDAVHLAAAAMLAYGLLHVVEAGVCGVPRPGRRCWAACRRPFTCLSISTPSSAIPAGPPGACWRSICLWSACWHAI